MRPLPTMPAGRYRLVHALAASAILLLAVSKDFWRHFLHGGFPEPPKVSVLLFALAANAALFGLVVLLGWGSSFFCRRAPAPAVRLPWGQTLKCVFVSFLPVCLTALLLCGASELFFRHVLHLSARGQDLVAWLKPGVYPAGVRVLLGLFAVFEAPLLEEPLFRGVIYRGFSHACPPSVALALSGLVFAIMHVNAVTLLPLWFLGVAFAWLYAKTGRLAAPMLAHLLFNVTNLLLLALGVSE